MANTVTNLLSAGITESASVQFEVELNAPVSLYLIPASGDSTVPVDSQMVIQRLSGATWINTEYLGGSTVSSAVLVGFGTFRAYRPAQREAVGIDLVQVA